MHDHCTLFAESTPSNALRRLFGAGWLLAIATLASHPAIAQTYLYLGDIGTSGPGALNFPNDVQIDAVSHNILVSDAHNNRVVVFNSAGTYLKSFGTGGIGDGQFNYPTGIAIDPQTRDIFVADYYNYRVERFGSDGTYLSQFAMVGDHMTPCGVVIQPGSRNIVVSTGYGASVQRFAPNLSYLGPFGDSTNFDYACFMTIAANGNILVADETVNNVQTFTPAGAAVSQFGSYGSGNGQFSSPNGMVIDPGTGHILVVDSGNDRIQVFDASGNYLSQFGGTGIAAGKFQVPVGLALDKVSNHLLVADRGNNRIQRFATCGSTLVSLSVLPGTQSANQAMLFSASIGNVVSPSGTVSMIAEDGSLVCTATTYGDPQAACSGYIQLGVHAVSAAYSGDAVTPSGCSQPSTVAVIDNTAPTGTTVTLVGPPNGIHQGEVFTLDATMAQTLTPGFEAPMKTADAGTGFITFMDGTSVLANVSMTGSNASYSNRIRGGAHSFSAVYSGDGTFASATANASVSAVTPPDDIFYDSCEVLPGN